MSTDPATAPPGREAWAREMLARLTPREIEILELAARHLTSKQIGPRLGLQPATVDTFMQAVIRKLDVAGRKDAVRLYLEAVSRGAPLASACRDNLDFGSSTMAVSDAAPPAAGVFDGEDDSRSKHDAAREWSLAGQYGDPPARRFFQRLGGGDLRRPWFRADTPDDDRRPGSSHGAIPLGASPVRTVPAARRMDRGRGDDPRPGGLAWFLSSAGRRLFLMAVITLGLGLVVVGATATGYDLTKVIDRLFVEHLYNLQGAKPPRIDP